MPFGDGDEVDEARATELAREAALRLLDRQPRTRRDLGRRLVERGHPPQAIQEALNRLEAVGVINDRILAEGFIRRRIKQRPRSPSLLRRELRARGVPVPAIEAALEAFTGELDEIVLARAALDRRPGLAKLKPEVRRRRVVATLRRLGFSSAAVAEVIRSIK